MNPLLESQIKSSKVLGFWSETYLAMLKKHLETRYNSDVIRGYYIDDLIIHGDKVLINWKPRIRPLTDEELTILYE